MGMLKTTSTTRAGSGEMIQERAPRQLPANATRAARRLPCTVPTVLVSTHTPGDVQRCVIEGFGARSALKPSTACHTAAGNHNM